MRWNHLDESLSGFKTWIFATQNSTSNGGEGSRPKGLLVFSTLGGKQPPPRFLTCFDDSAKTKDGRGFFLDPANTPESRWFKTSNCGR